MRIGISEHFIRRMWGSDDFRWAMVEPKGRSGGILCVCGNNFIKDEVVRKGARWIWIKGFIQEKFK